MTDSLPLPQDHPPAHTNQSLVVLTRLYEAQQKTRIGLGNRISAAERGTSRATEAELNEWKAWFDTFHANEKGLLKSVLEELKTVSVGPDLLSLRGIGPSLAGKLLARIDISRSGSVSALWRYAGQGVSDYWVNADGRVVAPLTGYKAA
ncbi:MAG: hypothetical protein L3J16_07115, partial [Anaerolineales bacterium]|nr:hypothetical protein [Anaerolineales bacterium]